MSCLQVFCKTLVGHLCLWYIFLWVSSSLSSLSIWLPLADCGGSILLKLSYILFILYWINFTLAPPGIPSASPLSSPNPDSSFLLEMMSIICLYLAQECSKSFNNHQHIKEKYFLSIIINCSCLLSGEQGGIFPRYLWYFACLLTHVDSAFRNECSVE